MSNSIERDIRAITQITTYVKTNITDYLPRFARKIKTSDTREKRGLGAAAGIILGGSAIANIFSSSYSSAAPFSFVGQSLSKLFGTATEDEIQHLEQGIMTNSKRLQFLELNKDEIKQAMKVIKTQMLVSVGGGTKKQLGLVFHCPSLP